MGRISTQFQHSHFKFVSSLTSRLSFNTVSAHTFQAQFQHTISSKSQASFITHISGQFVDTHISSHTNTPQNKKQQLSILRIIINFINFSTKFQNPTKKTRTPNALSQISQNRFSPVFFPGRGGRYCTLSIW